MSGSTTRPLLVVAIGVNALLRAHESPTVDTQRRHLVTAAGALRALADEHRLVVTHGNGPQVGLLALGAEASGYPAPLDVLDAESAGQIGFLIAEALDAAGGGPTAVVLTRVVVRGDDPGFDHPTKPIGPSRRLVASPDPIEIVELDAIRLLTDAGVTVVCAGGGGIPVVVTPDGSWRGVEAVVDKDLTAARLALDLDANGLLLLTDVDGLHDGWPDGPYIESAPVALLRAREWEPGSMAPKVEACCRFAEATGRPAMIGALEEAPAVAAGQSGTRIDP